MTIVKKSQDVKDFIPVSFTDLIDNFFNESAAASNNKRFWPPIDITEEEKKYKIEISVPGMKKEDFKIDLHEGKLLVSGERKFEKSENKKYHAVQTSYGTFERSFHLPENANPESIEAAYTDGILSISIQKDEKKIYKASIQVK